MARRRLDPCSRNARKGEKILGSIIGTGLKIATNSGSKRKTASNNGCMVTIILTIILTTSILFGI